jgi:hypothetical protein
VVALATGHFLLLAVLVIGPAFFVARYEPASSSKSQSTEVDRTFIINFNLRASRLL